MVRSPIIALCLVVASATFAEDWPQFRRDERHTGWSQRTLAGTLSRVHDGTLLIYGGGNWTPTDRLQLDTITVRGDIVLLTGSVAGGDPAVAHGSAKWAGYVSRSRQWRDAAGRGQGGFRPATWFLESSQPKAGIETDSGHHPCQYRTSGAQTGGFLMESGFLRFWGSRVLNRSQSDVFGPITCRDNATELVAFSRVQWHGGGVWVALADMRRIPASIGATLFSVGGAVPNTSTEKELLAYLIAYDAVYAGPYLATNIVANAGNPQNLPAGWTWPVEASGLCVWSLGKNPQPVACREGSWGQLATDGTYLWTYRQSPYDRTPWIQGGASRSLVALRLPDLTTAFEVSVGDMPITVQDAPLIGPASVVTAAWHPDGAHLEAYNRATFEPMWSSSVPIVPRWGGCPYWSARATEQVALAASGNSVVVASDGLTVLDATTGAQTWRGQPGVTYFNPTIVDGDLYVIRDDSGPSPDPVTRNCSGNGFEVWRASGFVGAPIQVPTLPSVITATPTKPAAPSKTVPPTITHTPTRTPTLAPTCVPGCSGG